MFDLIEKIRNKPERAKKRIAFLTALSFSSVIAVIWLSVIYPDLRFVENQKQSAAAVESGPTESFFRNIKEGFSGAKQQIDNIKESISGIASTTKHIQNNTTDTEPVYEESSVASTTINEDFDAGI